VVVEAAPSTTLEMSKSDFLLELLIIALDAPAQLGEVDQISEVAASLGYTSIAGGVGLIPKLARERLGTLS
jgi:hypothetical protein